MSAIVSGEALWQWRKQAQQQAIAAAVPVAELDWLLQSIAQIDRLSLRLGSLQTQPEIHLPLSLAELDRLWQRRLVDRVPVQYLAGESAWRNFRLRVAPSVLIPRPETELLIDLVLSMTQAAPALRLGHWADLGTGSGAIALGLATALPAAKIHAVDLSPQAIAVAQANLQANCPADCPNWGDRVQFYQGSWFEPIAHLRQQLSGMVSNPPYIPQALIGQLQPEVREHEPRLALDGGADGLDAIRQLVTIAPDYLLPGGLWLIELMAGQAESVMALLQATGCYRDWRAHRDLAGIDRFVLAYRV